MSNWSDLHTKKVYLSCSGGLDSMVLLHVLISLKVDVQVIHVNYQLRGEASNKDAELVESICLKNAIPCEIRRVDLKKQLSNGGNLQDEARKIRYEWFDEILALDPNNRVALAHHQDDQIETFFMNLARKSGVIGLACMKNEHEGIVRPLLDFSRLEIQRYAATHSVVWREDESNQTNNYTRNRLRNEFIPALKSNFPEIASSVLELVKQFQRKQLELEEVVSPYVESTHRTNSIGLGQFSNLSELERIELFRQLGLSASYVSRMHELKERGKRLVLSDNQYNAIVRDENQYTFLKKEDTKAELRIECVESLPTSFSKEVVYFDASKISGELGIRLWESGDRIESIGMSGSQLISDIIKDSKINANARANQLIVHDDERVLWCVGLKISRIAIADSNSNQIIRCSINVSTKEE